LTVNFAGKRTLVSSKARSFGAIRRHANATVST
jgi:hypothetical protein